jgi:hypothetical protein
MTSIAALVDRSGDLKRELVEFSSQRRFDRAFKQAVRQEFGGDVIVGDEGDFANFLDRFVLEWKLADGRTVVEHFVEAHPELSDAERQMLLGWQDVVESLFEVERRDGDAVLLYNLVDDLTYRTHANVGPSAFAPMAPRSFLLGRLVPVGDEWMLSGAHSLYPASARRDIYRTAVQWANANPALVFRNPEKLKQGWEFQCKEREGFIQYFGADLVVVPGHELVERMRTYMRWRIFDYRDTEGKTAAERTTELDGRAPTVPEFPFAPEITACETVAVIYDEVEGLNIYPEFGLIAEAFADPSLLDDRRYRDAVLNYLEEPTIGPLPLLRLAARDPERAGEVVRRTLRRRRFSWEKDAEALLRHYKARYYETPPLPGVLPVNDEQARATRAADDRRDRRRRRGRTRNRG